MGGSLVRGGFAFNGHITFAWDAATDPASVGYRLFYGTSPGVYQWYVDVGNVTQYRLSCLAYYDGAGQPITYYAAVQSLDAGGNLINVISNEASGTVFPGPGDGEILILSWQPAGCDIMAASASAAHVQAAVDAASGGQSVCIPDGSATWTAGQSVTITGKGITLRAHNRGMVTITHSAGNADLITIVKDAAHSTVIDGINFVRGTGGGSAARYINITGASSNKIAIIHHCSFQAHSALVHILRCISNGFLFYSNTVTAPTYHDLGVIQINPNSAGTAEWAAAHTLGTADTNGTANCYFEDNTFTGCLQQSVDGSNGARIVFRHNTMIDSACVIHGFDTDPFGGARHFEFYDNTFTRVTNAHPINRWLYIRGATGVITDNVFDRADSPDGSSYPNKVEIDLTVQSLRRSTGTFTSCWAGGYPCPHQVGQIDDATDATPDWPLAIWNNTGAGTLDANFIARTNYSPDECGGGPDVTTFIQEGRDYITSAASGYTKYTYPHPLRV